MGCVVVDLISQVWARRVWQQCLGRTPLLQALHSVHLDTSGGATWCLGSRVRPNAEIGVFQPNQEVPVTPGPESKALSSSSSSRKNKCRLAATGVTGFVCLKVNDLVAFRFRKFWTRRSPEPRVEEVIIRPVLTICSFQKKHARAQGTRGYREQHVRMCAALYCIHTWRVCVCGNEGEGLPGGPATPPSTQNQLISFDRVRGGPSGPARSGWPRRRKCVALIRQMERRPMK